MAVVTVRGAADGGCPAGADQLGKPAVGVGHFLLAERAQAQQGVVQFVGVANTGPGFGRNFGDHLRIEPRQVAHFLAADRAARGHGPGAALFERGRIQKGVRVGAQEFVAERRGLAGVAADEFDAAGLPVGEQGQEAVDVHRLVLAVVHRLADERVVGDRDVARVVFQAAHGFGKHGRQQIVGTESLQMRGHALAALLPQHRQRPGDVPAPAELKHRRRQQGLFEQRLGIVDAEHGEQRVDGKTVLRPERQHDAVVVGTGLQFEVEAAAEPLAQGETPGPIDSRSQRRVDHQLHAAGFVEEALEHDLPAGRHQAQRGQLRADVGHGLLGRPGAGTALAGQPAGQGVGCATVRRMLRGHGGQVEAQLRHRGRQLASAPGGFAQPEGHARRGALRIADVHFAAAHAEHAPGRIAQEEHVAGHALDGKILVHGADQRAVGLGHDAVQSHLGNRSARSERGDPGPAPRRNRRPITSRCKWAPRFEPGVIPSLASRSTAS